MPSCGGNAELSEEQPPKPKAKATLIALMAPILACRLAGGIGASSIPRSAMWTRSSALLALSTEGEREAGNVKKRG